MKEKQIAKKVKLFYEKSPFLLYNLEKINSKVDLYNIATSFSKSLDNIIPLKSNILDLGCGTGLLASLLSTKKRKVVGVDFSQTSIKYAKRLKKKLSLKNVVFMKGNISNLDLPKESFDYTFCLGVLHHIANPYAGFKVQCDLTKKGGFVILGLYNTYGRLFSRTRKFLFKMLRGRGRKIDYIMRKRDVMEVRKKIWFEDQYKHPYETTHTIDEVLGWFKKNNIEFINSVPKFKIFNGISLDKNLFEKYNDKNEHKRKLLHFLVQLKWIITRNREGGFFIIIGKKNK